MQIRQLTEQDKARFGAIQRDAFQFNPPGGIEAWTERVFEPEDSYAIFNEQNEIVTMLRLIYPQLWVGKASVTLAGVTGVATPPEHRRHGYLNKLLMHVMGEQREKGYGISGLYPFYFPFYRKFGYELASSSKRFKVAISELAKFKSSGGRWRQKEHADWPEFNALYDQFCQGRFGLISRDKRFWYGYFNNWNGNSNTAYIWYDDKGQARAYVIYAMRELEPWRRQLNVRDMVWLDETAFFEILAFLGNHDSQAEKVTWETPPDEDIFALLDDPRKAEVDMDAGVMLRILDAPLALTQRPWSPELSGSFSMLLRDDRLEWNNNLTIQVQVEGGQAQVKATKDSTTEAGLACDIRQLAQFYLGYISPINASRVGLLEVRRTADLQAAQSLFSPSGQPAPHMADHW